MTEPISGGAEKVLQRGSDADKPVRIGLIHYVGKGDAFIDTNDVAWFKSGMHKIGYREGENVQYLELYGDRSQELTQRNAKEIVDWEPDVIVSFLTNANLALKPLLELKPIPVVCWATDLMAAGLIESYRRPGGLFTGFSYVPYNNWAKIRLIKLLKPGIKRLAHFYNPTYSPAFACMEQFREAAEAMGMEFRVYETLSMDAFQSSTDAMLRDGCEAVVVGPHELFNTNGAILGEMFLRAGLPAVGNQLSIARNGGVASFNPGKRQGWPLMAFVVDEILQGTAPGDIPINRNLRGPFTLNLKAARALGIEVSAALLEEADVILE
ncbi:MAG: ABC transporter substrate-binding protein [Comamonadaceae bacterium]|nr:ABC transporter substrate-binding protein [Comamonadaceae bacterium]